MTSWTSCRRVLALLPLLAAAACGQGVQAESSAGDDALGGASTAPDALVLQVVRVGGFLPAGAAFRTVPSVSVYGDGRVVTEGAQIDIWPAPALPSVQVGRLDAAAVRRLVDAGREVVEAAADYGQPPVADAPTTAVLVHDGDRPSVAAAVALEELSGDAAPADGGGLTEDQRAARERLRAYVRQVQDAASAAPAQPYEPPGLAVLAEPYGAAAPDLPPSEVAWPGPALTPGSCVVVPAAGSAEVQAAAAGASVETRWTADGQVLRLAFRPLLPHERTCDDVQETVVPPGP